MRGFFAQRADYGQAYIDAVSKLMPLWMAPVLLAVCFVCGIIGGLLGRALLKQLKELGTIILVVTHDCELIHACCCREYSVPG